MRNKKCVESSKISGEDGSYLLEVWPIAKQVFNKPGYERIIEADFYSVYPTWQIQQDIQEVVTRKSLYNQDELIEKVKGEILEAIILDLFEMNLFVDDDIYTQRSALHDDYFRGVDLWLTTKKFGHKRGFDLIAIDVTSAKKFMNKFNKTISCGCMTTADYFMSKDLNIKPTQRVRQVPHIIIHVDNGILAELTRVWINSKLKKEGSNLNVYNHPFVLIILMEIIIQLEFQTSKQNKRMPDKIKEDVKKWLAYFKEIYNKKLEEIGIDEREILNANSVVRIRSKLGSVKM